MEIHYSNLKTIKCEKCSYISNNINICIYTMHGTTRTKLLKENNAFIQRNTKYNNLGIRRPDLNHFHHFDRLTQGCPIRCDGRVHLIRRYGARQVSAFQHGIGPAPRTKTRKKQVTRSNNTSLLSSVFSRIYYTSFNRLKMPAAGNTCGEFQWHGK
jgi:hypothetical protein